MKKLLLFIIILLFVFSCNSYLTERSYNIIKGIEKIETIKVNDITNNNWSKDNVIVARELLSKKIYFANYDIILYADNNTVILIKLKECK